MSVKIVIPMEPVGVNHYVKHTRSGRHYKTKEAIAFEQVGAIYCLGQSISAKAYSVTIHIFQGEKKKGDIDGYAKQVLDLLAANGVLLDHKGNRSTDAHVIELHMTKQRDRDNPRTEIIVEAVEKIELRKRRDGAGHRKTPAIQSARANHHSPTSKW